MNSYIKQNNNKKFPILYSPFHLIFIILFVITIIKQNFVSSYYVLPFKIKRPSLDDLYKIHSNISEDEIFLNYTYKMSLITLLKINDSLTIEGYIESSSVCSSLSTYSCTSDLDLNIIFNHNNVNLSNIFDIINKYGRNNFENNKCIKMIIGFGISQYNLSFVDEIKKNDNTVKTYTWSINYYDINNIKDFDGEIIIGIEPQDYHPSIYNENNYITINNYIDEDSYYFPMFENSEYGIQFNSIYFYINNNNSSKNIIKCINPTSMEGLFNFDKGMIQSPEEYFILIKNNFFNKYSNICKEIYFSNIYNYRTFVCEKNKLNEDEFYKNFPTLYFKHVELNYIFELTAKDLFKEENNKIYFMIFSSDVENWHFGEIFMKKYFFSFNQNKKSISFYFNNIKNEEKNDKTDEGNTDTISNLGIIFLCVGIVLIIINGIIFGICIYKNKCRINRRKRANELNDDNYDYLTDDNSNKNKIINDN